MSHYVSEQSQEGPRGRRSGKKEVDRDNSVTNCSFPQLNSYSVLHA